MAPQEDRLDQFSAQITIHEASAGVKRFRTIEMNWEEADDEKWMQMIGNIRLVRS